MKYLLKSIALSAVITLTSCTSNPTYVLAPWECASSIDPVDAVVIRKEGGLFVYDCLWNGGGPSGEGEGDGEGGGSSE